MWIYLYINTPKQGRIYVGAGGGHVPPRFTCCPAPDSKASWPFWRDFWQNANFPDPAGGAYSAPPDHLLTRRGLAAPLPRTGPPLYALWASFLQVSGSNQNKPITELATILMIDFKCRPIWSSYFFGFGERRKWTQWWRSWGCNAP